jgi:hypothetical protein
MQSTAAGMVLLEDIEDFSVQEEHVLECLLAESTR